MAGGLVTFASSRTVPTTGYGYIEAAENSASNPGIHRVRASSEARADLARQYFEAGLTVEQRDVPVPRRVISMN